MRKFIKQRAFILAKNSTKKQSGQAIVLVLLLTVIGVISGIALVSTGVLTSEKMQLQNAADATAYSVSVLEARDLNYGAYMNRAMVANEVAIGQMVSLHAWANMLEEEPDNLRVIGEQARLIPYIGPGLQKAIEVLAKYKEATSKVANKIIDPLAAGFTSGLGLVNEAYGASQKLMHLATLTFSYSAVKSIPNSNLGELQQSAGISNFGYFSLAMHYGSFYGDLLTLPVYQFVRHPANDGKKNSSDIVRLSQVVNDSRDNFTKNRSCSGKEALVKSLNSVPEVNSNDIIKEIKKKVGSIFDIPIAGAILEKIASPIFDAISKRLPEIYFNTPKFDCVNGEGGWKLKLINAGVKRKPIELAPSISNPACFFPLNCVGLPKTFEFSLTLGANIYSDANRKGGTQIVKGGDDDTSLKWAAADGAKLDSGIKDVYVKVCFFICYVVPTNQYNRNFAGDLGYGAGIAGGGKVDGDFSRYSGIQTRDQMYGELWQYDSPWAKIKEKLQKAEKKEAVSDNYHFASGGYQMVNGLPQIGQSKKDFAAQVSSSGSFSFTGLEAPYILIALTQSKKESFHSKNQPQGNFKLSEGEPDIAVIGKAEVYYSDPNKSIFNAPADYKSGAANGFNPYWDARLIDTSYYDRIAALIFQSQQLPKPGEAVDIFKNAHSTLDNFNKLTGKLGGLFNRTSSVIEGAL